MGKRSEPRRVVVYQRMDDLEEQEGWYARYPSGKEVRYSPAQHGSFKQWAISAIEVYSRMTYPMQDEDAEHEWEDVDHLFLEAWRRGYPIALKAVLDMDEGRGYKEACFCNSCIQGRVWNDAFTAGITMSFVIRSPMKGTDPLDMDAFSRYVSDHF